jgi:hypothetical protein
MEEKTLYVQTVANADGKCFQCGEFVMECGCWLKGIDSTYYDEFMRNQPERLNPETQNA